MDGMPVVLMMVAVVMILAIVVVIVQRQHEQRRREHLRELAAQMQFSFSAEPPAGLWDAVRGYQLFSQGHSRRIYNVMQRHLDGISMTVFDYRYSTHQGKHNRVRYQTVLLFESERLQLPDFSLRPESILHKFAGAFGYQDIDFGSHLEFSESYLLQGSDEVRIRALFDDETLAYYTRHPNLYTEGAGQRLMVYRSGWRADPGALPGFVEQSLDVLDLFVEKEGLAGTLPLLGLDVLVGL